jgi:hypothetical protein
MHSQEGAVRSGMATPLDVSFGGLQSILLNSQRQKKNKLEVRVVDPTAGRQISVE